MLRAPATTSAPSVDERVRDGEADALAGAGDDGDLAAQLEVHLLLVVLDDVLGPDARLLRVLARLTQRAAAAQQVPELVEAHLQRVLLGLLLLAQPRPSAWLRSSCSRAISASMLSSTGWSGSAMARRTA